MSEREKVEERARAFVFDGFQTSIIPGTASLRLVSCVLVLYLSISLVRLLFVFHQAKKKKKGDDINYRNKQTKKEVNQLKNQTIMQQNIASGQRKIKEGNLLFVKAGRPDVLERPKGEIERMSVGENGTNRQISGWSRRERMKLLI